MKRFFWFKVMIGMMLSLVIFSCGSSSVTGPQHHEHHILSFNIVTDSNSQNQTGYTGKELPSPIYVTLTSVTTDSVGNQTKTPVPNQLINWIVVSGKGSLFEVSSLTSDSGKAFNRWTLGDSIGVQSIEARALDSVGNILVQETITATAVPTQFSVNLPSTNAMISWASGDNNNQLWNTVYLVTNDSVLDYSQLYVKEWSDSIGSIVLDSLPVQLKAGPVWGSTDPTYSGWVRDSTVVPPSCVVNGTIITCQQSRWPNSDSNQLWCGWFYMEFTTAHHNNFIVKMETQTYSICTDN